MHSEQEVLQAKMRDNSSADCSNQSQSGKANCQNNPETQSTSVNPIKFGPSKRIIRKVVLLEPSKIKRLGLESKLIEAVSKFRDSSKANTQNLRVFESETQNKLNIYKRTKTTIHNKFCLLVNNEAISAPSCVKRESVYENKAEKHVETAKQLATQVISEKLYSEKTQNEEFKGFTSLEIVEEIDSFARLTKAIVASKDKQEATISSFTHVRSYLNCRKHKNVRKPSKYSQIKFYDPNTTSQIKAEIDNAVSNKRSKSFSMKSNAASSYFPCSGSTSNQKNCVLEEKKYSDLRLASCSKSQQSMNAAKVSDKRIIILDQKIIKSGSPLSIPFAFQGLLGSSFQSIDPHQTDCHRFGGNFSRELSAIKPDVISKQIVPIKIECNDSKLPDLQAALLTPNMSADPIKSICKTFVKKMMKSPCNSRASRDECKSEYNIAGGITIDGDAAHRAMSGEQNNQTPVSNEFCSGFPKGDLLAIERHRENYLITPKPDFDQSEGPTGYVTLFSNVKSENTEGSQQHNGSFGSIYENEKTCGSQNFEPMDAVEYILHCSQNYSIESTTKFENENEEVLEEFGWSDGEEKETKSPININFSNATLIEERKHKRYQKTAVQVDASSSNIEPKIMNEVKKAFVADIKTASTLTNSPESKKFSPVESRQRSAKETQIPMSKNNPLEIMTKRENAFPAHYLDTSERKGSIDCNIQKKRKRTIMDYTNAIAPIDEISERIKRRMNSRLSMPMDVHNKVIATPYERKKEDKDMSSLLFDLKFSTEGRITIENEKLHPQNTFQSENKSETGTAPSERHLILDARQSTDNNEAALREVEDSVQQALLEESISSKLIITNELSNNSSRKMSVEANNENSIPPKSNTTTYQRSLESEISILHTNNKNNTPDHVQSYFEIVIKEDQTDEFHSNEDAKTAVNRSSTELDTSGAPECDVEIVKREGLDVDKQINESDNRLFVNTRRKSARKQKPINKSDFIITKNCRRKRAEVKLKTRNDSEDSNPSMFLVSKEKDVNRCAKSEYTEKTDGTRLRKLSIPSTRKVGRPRRTPLSLTNSSGNKIAILESGQELNCENKFRIANKNIAYDSEEIMIQEKKLETPKSLESDTNEIKKKNVLNDYKIHPKMLIVNSREEFRKIADEEAESVDSYQQIIKQEDEIEDYNFRCGACKRSFSGTNFKEHLKQHYGVGWRDGYEKPINMSSYREVLNAMTYYMQHFKVSHFTCKICGEKKKSAAGLIVHIQTCLLDKDQLDKLMKACEFCSKIFLPPALWTHNKTCRSNPEKQKKSIECAVQLDDIEGQKRRSAIKATSSFKTIVENSFEPAVDDLVKVYCMPRRPGLIIKWKNDIKKYGITKCFEKSCSFESCDVNAMKTHAKNCVNIRRGGFICVRCQFYDVDETKVRSHVKERHEKILHTNTSINCEPMDESKDFSISEPDMDSTDGSSIVEENKVTGAKVAQIAEQNCFNTTQTICNQMYSENLLYPELRPSFRFSQLSYNGFKSNIKASVRFGFTKNQNINKYVGATEAPHTWTQLKQGETKVLHDEAIVFVGGPVSNCIWAPTPSSVRERIGYLAVTFKYGYNYHIKCVNPKEDDTLILVYRVDLMDSKMDTNVLYGIKCCGPIHHLAFMPSGGFAPNINRLGLLAVATVKSDINIYALPLNAFENKCYKVKGEQVSCRIIDLNPSLVLCIDLCHASKEVEDFSVQCLQISWTEMKEHNLIAAGFSNGYAGLWDIRNKDNLSKFSRDDVPYFVPLSYFNAIPHGASGIALHYTMAETRWMVVTNRMRDFRIYDLEDIRNPLPLVKDGFQKSSLSSTVWPIYSENPALALDDDFIEDACTVFTRSVMNVYYRTKSHIQSPSGVNTLCFTPWHNTLIAGCENGDIILQRLKTLSMENNAANKFPKKFIFFTDIVKLDGQSIPLVKSAQLKEATSSEQIQMLDSFKYQHHDSYGLIFGGPAACSRNEKNAFMSMDRVTPFSLRPLTRVNCVSLCSNAHEEDIAAIGYNNGLIRIKALQFSDFY